MGDIIKPDECMDHWHCDPSRHADPQYAHPCEERNRQRPCPTCGQKPQCLVDRHVASTNGMKDFG